MIISMFKSSAMGCLKPSNLNNKSCILGIGKGFLSNLIFNSLKSEMKQTLPFFLGIIKVEAAHLALFLLLSTSLLIHLLTSVFRLSLCILRIKNRLIWYGLATSTSLILYSKPV